MHCQGQGTDWSREQNRDISEKVALGLAKPTMSKESMTDARLFNRETLSGSFGDDDSYNLYDKPLFQGSSAAAAIYRRPGTGNADDIYGGGTEEGINEELENDRFGLGKTKGFEGSQFQQVCHRLISSAVALTPHRNAQAPCSSRRTPEIRLPLTSSSTRRNVGQNVQGPRKMIGTLEPRYPTR